VSTKEAARQSTSRGSRWDSFSKAILRRDGAYKDSEGRWHGVCLNYSRALELGLLDTLPRQCARTNGEDEVWACHGQGWSTHPALRFEEHNIIALCKHCDPDRNPLVRPRWWGNSASPVVAGWERGNRWTAPTSGAVTLLGVALLGLSGAFAYLMFFRGWPSSWTTEALACAAGAMPCLSTKHRLGWATFDLGTAMWFVLAGLDLLARSRWHVGISPYHFGVFLFTSVGAYAGCLLAAHIVLRGHRIGRFTRACLHGLVRVVRHAKEPQRTG
jgi:hypothetical protein